MVETPFIIFYLASYDSVFLISGLFFSLTGFLLAAHYFYIRNNYFAVTQDELMIYMRGKKVVFYWTDIQGVFISSERYIRLELKDGPVYIFRYLNRNDLDKFKCFTEALISELKTVE